MTHRPRHLRSAERGLRVADQARNAGKSAMDCALADIPVKFDRSARINQHKMRVENALKLGAMSEHVRSLYSPVTAILRRLRVRTIDGAVCVIGAEKARTETIESYIGSPRLAIRRDTLDEALLALRWMRAHRPIDMQLLIALMSDTYFGG